MVHGAEHVGFAYRRLLAHSISSPLISIRDQIIKTSIYHLLHTVCCSEARILRLGCWKHVILGIADLFQHTSRELYVSVAPSPVTSVAHLALNMSHSSLSTKLLPSARLRGRLASTVATVSQVVLLPAPHLGDSRTEQDPQSNATLPPTWFLRAA